MVSEGVVCTGGGWSSFQQLMAGASGGQKYGALIKRQMLNNFLKYGAIKFLTVKLER